MPESENDPNDKGLQEWICRENIKNLRAQLAAAHDEARLRMLLTLLAEQEAKLARIGASRQEPDQGV